VPHTFANLGDEAVWAFGVTTPAGLEGMFSEQAEYFASLTAHRILRGFGQSATGTAFVLWDQVSLRIDDSAEHPRPQQQPNARICHE
jgi:hypothetical protein